MHGYLDGELIQREKFRFETHLKECPQCTHELELLQKATSLFFESIVPSKEELLSDNVWPKIEAQITTPINISDKEKNESFFEKWLLDILITFKKPAIAIPALLIVTSYLTVTFFRPGDSPKATVVTKSETPKPNKISDYPIVESVHKPDVTVLTMNTSDPHIKVVWFFDKQL